MPTEYHIAIHFKTEQGFETCGQFFLGTDKAEARLLFSRLKGDLVEVQEGILIMEFRTIYRNLPIDVQILGVTLEQLGENCKTITKHLFNRKPFDRTMISDSI